MGKAEKRAVLFLTALSLAAAVAGALGGCGEYEDAEPLAELRQALQPPERPAPDTLCYQCHLVSCEYITLERVRLDDGRDRVVCAWPCYGGRHYTLTWLREPGDADCFYPAAHEVRDWCEEDEQ